MSSSLQLPKVATPGPSRASQSTALNGYHVSDPDYIYFYQADEGEEVPLQVGLKADVLSGLQANQGVRCWKAGTRGRQNSCDDALIRMSGVWEHYADGVFHTIRPSVFSPPVVCPVHSVSAVAGKSTLFATEPHISPHRQWGLPKCRRKFSRAPTPKFLTPSPM